MIDTDQFKEVLHHVEVVSRLIREHQILTRNEVADIRVRLTHALAQTNKIEQIVAGVPPPKSGD